MLSFHKNTFGSPVQMAVRSSRFLGIRKVFALQIEESLERHLWKASFQGLDETLVRDPLRKDYGRYWKRLDFQKFVDPWGFRRGKIECVCLRALTHMSGLAGLLSFQNRRQTKNLKE